MPYTAIESADVAADELVSLLTTLRDGGEFDAQLGAIRTALGKDDNYTLLIAKRDNPVTILNDTDESLYGHLLVSLLPGFEGHRSLQGNATLEDNFQLGFAVETHVGGSPTATELLRKLSRTLADWLWWKDPTATRRERRQLTTSPGGGRVTLEDIVALIDPSQLSGSSVFLALRKFYYEGVC